MIEKKLKEKWICTRKPYFVVILVEKGDRKVKAISTKINAEQMKK